jgi:hypothetical protein
MWCPQREEMKFFEDENLYAAGKVYNATYFYEIFVHMLQFC